MPIPICEIELTNRCNANCIMCPRTELERPLGSMDFDTLKLVVVRCVEYGVLQFAFSGFGEPLLNKNIVDYVKYVREKLPQIKINITTNAALLKKTLAQKLVKAGLDEVQISFNGWDKTSFEKVMRGLSFKEVLKNIKDLKELSVELGKPKILVIPILMKIQQKKDIPKIRGLLTELGLGKENFGGYYICNNRSGYFRNAEIVDEKFYLDQGIKLYPCEKIVCKIPFLINWIDWRGWAHLCCNDIKDKMILGDLKEVSLKEIELKRLGLVKKGAIPSICKSCSLPFLLGEGQVYVLKK